MHDPVHSKTAVAIRQIADLRSGVERRPWGVIDAREAPRHRFSRMQARSSAAHGVDLRAVADAADKMRDLGQSMDRSPSGAVGCTGAILERDPREIAGWPVHNGSAWCPAPAATQINSGAARSSLPLHKVLTLEPMFHCGVIFLGSDSDPDSMVLRQPRMLRGLIPHISKSSD
jgi:hypothetical protein